MALNFTNIFTQLGHLFGACVSANNSAGTTLPLNVQNTINDFANFDPSYQQIIQPEFNALTSYQGAANSFDAQCAGVAENIIIQAVLEDNPLVDQTITTALNELIRQMKIVPTTVKRNTAGSSVTQTVGSSDTTIVVSTTREDGLPNENVIPDNLLFKVIGVPTSPGGVATISVTSDPEASSSLGFLWPGGSGLNLSTSSINTYNGANVLVNGSFDTESDPNGVGTQHITDMPAGWSAAVATPSTTTFMSTTEVQTVIISGTPSAGYYQIVYQNSAGKQQVTVPIPYNATGSIVQTALNALTDLGAVTVTSTGTTPNFTHNVTFNGVAGSPTLMTVLNNTTSGSFNSGSNAFTRSPTGTVAYQGRAFSFVGNGSELTNIYQRITLAARQPYMFCGFMRRSATASGTVIIELVDGFTGAVINDDQGVANSLSITVGSLSTTSFAPQTAVFRTPTNLPALVYFRVRASVAINSGQSVYMDSFTLANPIQLYPGGPFVEIFAGGGLVNLSSPAAPNDPLLNDYWTIGVTNTWSNPGTSKNVTGTAAATNTGFVRLTLTGHGFFNGGQVTVASVTGTTEANGTWYFNVVDANHIDLLGVKFVNAWISGGTALPLYPGFQSWMEKAFDMRALNLLLPSTSGGPTIADTLIV